MNEPARPISKPVPVPDEYSVPFFEGANRHVLMVMRCNSCHTYQSPGRFACDRCLSDDLEWVEASGFGTVYTFVHMYQRYHPAFNDDIPYNVTIVELEEGPRLITNVLGVEKESLYAGMPVQVTFEDLTDAVSVPRFRPR